MDKNTAEDSGVRLAVPQQPLSPAAILATCHDLLNVAASLVMNVELLALECEATDDRREAAEDACASVERLGRIVRELQKTARAAAQRAA